MRNLASQSLALGFLLFLATNLPGLEYVESSAGLGYPQLEGGRTELEFADINGDGDVDILSIGDHGSPYINTNEHGIMVWFGDGSGSWSVYQNGNFGYGGIAVGDVNGDGLLDVGYAMHHNYSGNDFGDQLIEVALGDGTGQNWTPWDDGLATNGESWGMFGTDFADVDNDGDLDVGSNSFGCCSGVHVYLNEGDGSWTQSFGFLSGNSDMDFMFGDINGDGNVDCAAKNQDGTVYFGDGDGGFVNADGNLPSYSYYGTALGDVDNDGGLDLSCITGYSGAVEVWIWDEDLEVWVDFTGNLVSGSGYESTQLWDMNVDGYVDVAAFGDATFAVWLGDGAGNWTEDGTFSTPPYGNCEALRVGGDVDHNGFPDVALVSEEGSWPSDINHLRCFRETSIAESLAIAAVFPRGGETFMRGSVQRVDWVSAVPGDEESLVSLEYSLGGPGGPWTTIADGLPNNGRHQWTVPNAHSSDCYIRYTVRTDGAIELAMTPAAFSIEGDGTGVCDPPGSVDRAFLTNCPNPFRLSTRVLFFLADDARVALAVYSVSGRRVLVLADGVLRGGWHEAGWDARDAHGARVASGLYFLRLKIGEREITRRLVLLR